MLTDAPGVVAVMLTMGLRPSEFMLPTVNVQLTDGRKSVEKKTTIRHYYNNLKYQVIRLPTATVSYKDRPNQYVYLVRLGIIEQILKKNYM